MKKLALTFAAATAVVALAAPAQAAVTLSYVNGSGVYSGPTPTYDFEGAGPTGGAPISGGAIETIYSLGNYVPPLGTAGGHYWAVGPSTSNPGILNLAAFNQIGAISFIWGSADAYNTLEVLDSLNNVMASFTGANVAPAIPNGQGSCCLPAGNPLVTLKFTGADVYNVTSLRLKSSRNAFEVDKFAIAPVPEPATWAMMLIGFGAVGFAMRNRRNPRVSFA